MTPPRFHDGLRLVATRTAISCSRLFVESTLRQWGAVFLVNDAVQVVDELVTDAVKATGTMDEPVRWTEVARIKYITVRLLAFETTIRIEVWDSAPNPPRLPDNTESPIKRGCYPTPRGKVVWAELPVFPERRTPRQAPQAPPEEFGQYPELLRRVRNGLDSL